MIAAVATCLLVAEFTAEYTSAPPPKPDEIRPLLNGYYRQNGRPFLFVVNVAALRLKSGDDAAAEFLVAVLDQALKDETSDSTPLSDGGRKNAARNARMTCAQVFASAPPGPATLRGLKWVFDHDSHLPFHNLAARALEKHRGPEAAKVRANAIATSPNMYAVAELLKQATASDETISPDTLKPLCTHHRFDVRDAARELNRKLGYPEPPVDQTAEPRGEGPGHAATPPRTAPSAWWFVAIGVPTLVLILLIRRRMGLRAER